MTLGTHFCQLFMFVMFTFSYSISLGRSSVDPNVNKLMSISRQLSVILYNKDQQFS